jgi:hypothetical protein
MLTPRRVSGGGVRENGVPTCRTGAEEKKEVMSRKLNVQNVVLAAALLLGAGVAFAGGKDAKCADAKSADVKTACTKTGKPLVADAMKEVVKAAKAKGKDHKCTDCHKDQDKFELKDGAEANFKKLLGEAGM